MTSVKRKRSSHSVRGIPENDSPFSRSITLSFFFGIFTLYVRCSNCAKGAQMVRMGDGSVRARVFSVCTCKRGKERERYYSDMVCANQRI